MSKAVVANNIDHKDPLSFLDDIDIIDFANGNSGSTDHQEMFSLLKREIDDDLNLLFNDDDNNLFDVQKLTANNVKVEPEVYTDCMWSSADHARDRKRDVSITLSECAEGLATITSMEMFDFLENEKTPPEACLDNASLMWNQLNEDSDTDTDNEEIDVVTSNDDDVQPWVKQQQQMNIQRIKPGKRWHSNIFVQNFSNLFKTTLTTCLNKWLFGCHESHPGHPDTICCLIEH